MAAHIPPKMRCLVAPKKCAPSAYEVRDMPTPAIKHPAEVLIQMHAAAINSGDTQLVALGGIGPFVKLEFPAIIGIEGAGVVVEVGSGVKTLRVGDAVYGACIDKPMARNGLPGFVAEYAVSEERFLLLKPPHLSFEEAASLPALVVTALQVIRRGLQLRGEESLHGKTVYVPGALSATGSLGIQVAKNHFGAERIISTASTPKMALVEEYLPGMVDQLIDYTKQRVTDAVAPGSADFAYDTQWSTLDDCIAVLNKDAGTIAALTGIPRKETLREIIGADRFPAWLGWLLDLGQLWYRWKLRGTGIRFEMVSGGPQIREDMERAGEIVALGKVRAVMTVVELGDVEAVRAACERTARGKGGLGKLVIKIR
ncbi:hypothetical protein S40285_06180 [Stachybotrys chlorohalonatus IBT 40285]|uniref:Enoyl reductase (ER) domain-containing protein n=1 Tax=Stachybotrys chlorohalonatus (strain IBT 40285) TaxID=1283841 RepID=A0A084QA69_STAC4|nr:hypothetical protein S40285_06180 [Stachybotrys chlorohalonata IBT 40285]